MKIKILFDRKRLDRTFLAAAGSISRGPVAIE